MILPTTPILRQMADNADEKYNFYFQKTLKARKPENREIYREKYQKERIKHNRLCDLIMKVSLSIYGKKFSKLSDIQKQKIAKSYELSLERKVQRKHLFETTIRVSLFFFQSSLTADYGQFQCEKCSSIFYHSPARIMQGKELLYSCVCGYCANNISGEYIYN